LQSADPDYFFAVYYDAPDIVINQTILLCEIDKRFSVKFDYASFSSEPNITFFVLNNSSYRDTTEAFVNREIIKSISVVADDSIAIGPEL
jgi:exopolysaccharide biosynthesis predicted pyruvyltransferase EpsI